MGKFCFAIVALHIYSSAEPLEMLQIYCVYMNWPIAYSHLEDSLMQVKIECLFAQVRDTFLNLNNYLSVKMLVPHNS